MKLRNSHTEPQAIGDILAEVVDEAGREIHIDPVAEQRRKLIVAERLTEVLQQTRSELIASRQAGEPVVVEDISIIGRELQQTMAQREALRQWEPGHP